MGWRTSKRPRVTWQAFPVTHGAPHQQPGKAPIDQRELVPDIKNPYPATHWTATDELLHTHGVYRRPLVSALGLLQHGCTFDELVRGCAIPRRTAEELLDALRADRALTANAGRLMVDKTRTDVLPQRIEDLDPWPSTHAELRPQVREWVHSAPRAVAALDHVPATPATGLRRAVWLTDTYQLDDAHIVFIGDHDLTALATCAVNPRVRATVVDIDEDLLAYIDRQATTHGFSVQCLTADLRFAVPASVVGAADLVITDPPYTPEGISLFAARAAATLRDRERGRVIVAYGFSDLAPALGWKVQRALSDLHLTAEAILPHFNRYHGAQAVGSASDLYILRPTARTWRALDAATDKAAQIYTHGAQSIEAAPAVAVRELIDLVHKGLTERSQAAASASVDAMPEGIVSGRATSGLDIPTARLHTVLTEGLPGSLRDKHLIVDLTDDIGPLLLRALLAINAPLINVVVRESHPDLAALDALANLISIKYTLKASAAGPGLAVVTARLTALAGLNADRQVLRRIFERAHGKLSKTWAQALASHTTLTQRDARTYVEQSWPGPAYALALRPMELPRHHLTSLGACRLTPHGD